MGYKTGMSVAMDVGSSVGPPTSMKGEAEGLILGRSKVGTLDGRKYRWWSSGFHGQDRRS